MKKISDKKIIKKIKKIPNLIDFYAFMFLICNLLIFNKNLNNDFGIMNFYLIKWILSGIGESILIHKLLNGYFKLTKLKN